MRAIQLHRVGGSEALLYEDASNLLRGTMRCGFRSMPGDTPTEFAGFQKTRH